MRRSVRGLAPARTERRFVQASTTAANTRSKPGMPIREVGGQYVPPKNGCSSGVRKTDIGQPPRPVSICTAVM